VPAEPSEDPRIARSRARVLEAAIAQFLDGGPAAVTIDAVAGRSGVARTTIYRHWANREQLLAEVFRTFHFDLTPPPADLPTTERLHLVMRQLAETLRRPIWRRAIPAMLEAAVTQGGAGPGAAQLRHADDLVLIPLLVEATTDGTLPTDTDLKEAFLQLTSALLVASVIEPEGVDDAFVARQVELFLASRR
jgi:AcrR family transcriptional regulator